MAKTVKERKIDTPAARAKLAVTIKPYWRSIDTGLHQGYRRGINGGAWVGRRYTGDKIKPYVTETIGIADDHSAANGATILNFFQAQARIREWAAQASVTVTAKGPLTVAMAMTAYFDRLEQEGSKSLSDARGRVALHITPALGEMYVADITRDIIAGWLAKLPGRPKGDQDAGASANRVLNILRAALNQAFRDDKTPSDTGWRRVKPFKDVDSPRLRYFTRDKIQRLINAAQGTFRDLVKAGLFSGCRYGELGRLRAADFNADSGTIFIGKSKSGKARHVVLTGEGQKFFSALTAGKSADALILTREDGKAWGRSDHILLTTRALAAARITGASFHILRHTAASQMVMAGVPLHVVAQNLGHADTRMTERHYAHLSPSYVADQIRRLTPDYGLAEETSVVPMRGSHG